MIEMNELKNFVYHEIVLEGADRLNDGEEIPDAINLFEEVIDDHDICRDIGLANIESMRTYVLSINRAKLLQDINTEASKPCSPGKPIRIEMISDILGLR